MQQAYKKNIPSHILLSIVSLLLASCLSSVSTPGVTENARGLNTTGAQGNDTFGNCEYSLPDSKNSPRGFMNIFPGETMEDEIVPILGEPESIYEQAVSEIIFWSYPGYLIEIDDHAVIQIRLEPGLFLTLDHYLSMYGCPEGVFELLVSEDSEVSALILVFPESGLSLEFSHLSVHGNEFPISVFFFEPSALEDFVQNESALRDMARKIKWNEAYHQ